ncbi:MAG: hypothetical protein IJJ26_10575 [Victivallales bacterium]|nr:hypothetical protein [Victivallales bacterium]
MDNQRKRIIAAGLVAFAIVTAIILLLPKDVLVWCGYAALLLDVVFACACLLQLTARARDGFLTGVAFPLVLYSGLAVSAILSVACILLDVTGIWRMPWTWFFMLQVIVLGFVAWKALAIGAGQEAIQQVGAVARPNVSAWKQLLSQAEALRLEAPEGLREQIKKVCEAIRYADPISAPETVALQDSIAQNLSELKVLSKEGKLEEAGEKCTRIQNLVRQRAELLKAVK